MQIMQPTEPIRSGTRRPMRSTIRVSGYSKIINSPMNVMKINVVTRPQAPLIPLIRRVVWPVKPYVDVSSRHYYCRATYKRSVDSRPKVRIDIDAGPLAHGLHGASTESTVEIGFGLEQVHKVGTEVLAVCQMSAHDPSWGHF